MTTTVTPLGWRILNVAGPVAELCIYDDIGADGVTLADFTRALAGVRADRIDLVIHCSGGDALQALGMFSALTNWRGVVAATTSLAASAASVVMCAADHVVMRPNGRVMIHEPYASDISGDAAALAQASATVDQVGDMIAKIYCGKAGGTVEQWRARMRRETWYDAEQAVAAGLADAVEGPARRPMSREEVAAAALIAGRQARAELAGRIAASVDRAVRQQLRAAPAVRRGTRG